MMSTAQARRRRTAALAPLALGLTVALWVATSLAPAPAAEAQITYTATATLTDNHGNPTPNVAGQEEFTTVTSDSQGVLVYTGTSNTQAADGLTVFDAPMERPVSGETDFHWPEGPNSVEVTAP